MAKKTGAVAPQIEEWLAPVAADLNCEVVDVEYVKEAGEFILRVYIDREGGVDHELCESVSRQLSEILDENDPIEENYFLEVSSPGIERPLKKEQDFIRFAGKKAELKLFASLDGKKKFVGELKGFDDGFVLIISNGEEEKVPLDKIAKAKLVFEF